MFTRLLSCILSLAVCPAVFGQPAKSPLERANSLLKQMTLEEKVGQLHQISNPFSATGPITPEGDIAEQIRSGQVGSMLNVIGADRTRQLQELALQSRLRIPLLFGQDVIHGYRTTFPIPLAEAASWDLKTMQQTARMAATETAAAGVHWVFAPMVDIGRDPRWGRVMEGAGEDPWLGSRIAEARVKGFQGAGPGDTAAVLACAKHFAAYGAAVGGRDYNTVDMSDRQLWETYLPPFEAAVKAGVATVMNSFNDLNGIPASAHKSLQTSILKDTWGFRGFVVSDWGSIGEMIAHGYSRNLKQAAEQAIMAGNDMDMESRAYRDHLANLVRSGQVPVSRLDDAVRRILVQKFALGLFDDPFKFCSPAREAAQFNNARHVQVARQMAQKSMVLLKNDTINGLPVLPLSKTARIALIGPLVKSAKDHLGFWSFDHPDDSLRLVSLYDGMLAASASPKNIQYARGCYSVAEEEFPAYNPPEDTRTPELLLQEAMSVAAKADVVVLHLGEVRWYSGEAKSRSNITLSTGQQRLIDSLHTLGKPMVLLIGAGRPIIFDAAAGKCQAVVYTWWLGMQAGHAMADVLYGAYAPSGRLPMTFPRSVGQIPVYYNHYQTGRPAANDNDRSYVSAYIDLPNSPAYPFGYGLSYTRFQYSRPTISDSLLRATDTLRITCTITNTGTVAATETVQLYTRQHYGAAVRPVKELKGFKQLALQAGQAAEVRFSLTVEDLKYYWPDLRYDWEPGLFDIMVGAHSGDLQKATITWLR